MENFQGIIGCYYFDTRNFLNKDSIDFKMFSYWFIEKENIENEGKFFKKNFNFELDSLKVIRLAMELFLSEIEVETFKNLRGKRRDYPSDFNAITNLPRNVGDLTIDKNGKKINLSRLSSGEKSILLLVADITRRLVQVRDNPNKNILETRGFVLIDEIETHLHPNWQRKILPALTKTFPNIQFIVTTHSPQVVSSLDKESVFILEDFKLVQNTPYTKGRDANSILSEVFGVPRWTEAVRAKINKLYRLIDDESNEEALKALKELEKDFGPDDLELMRANMFLDFMEEEAYTEDE